MRRQTIVIAVLLALVGAAVLGAIGDWFWWEPYSGIVITIVAVLVLAVAVILAVVPRSRKASLVVAAVAVGLIVGQTVGPGRPALYHSDGTMTVTLTAPQATTGTTPVVCSMDATGAELALSGDMNLRLDVIPDDPSVPADVDQREFVGVDLTVGDRWLDAPSPRTDNRKLSITVGRVEAKFAETRMTSAPASTLDLDHSTSGGTLSFAGLVPEIRANEPSGEPVDVAGTLAWTCGEPY